MSRRASLRADIAAGQRRRIGVLGFDGVNALDVVGPAEAFANATAADGQGRQQPCYELVVVGTRMAPFSSESGVSFVPDVALAQAPAIDTLLVPGGLGLRNGACGAQLFDWLRREAPRFRRIASVCTGVYALASAGLLQGRKVSTHWRFAADLQARFPDLRVDADALYVKDGKYYTSAGITAGIDLALALIEEDHGPAVALAVARELVVYLKRSGGQEQYSEPLRFQTRAQDPFAALGTWMLEHLHEELSVQRLAEQAHLGERHFRRRFKAVFGVAPARHVASLRLEEARRRLTLARGSVERVAASVGFGSVQAFRRAFERRYGVAPAAFRDRFGSRD